MKAHMFSTRIHVQIVTTLLILSNACVLHASEINNSLDLYNKDLAPHGFYKPSSGIQFGGLGNFSTFDDHEFPELPSLRFLVPLIIDALSCDFNDTQYTDILRLR